MKKLFENTSNDTQLHLSVFDKNDPVQHTMKTMGQFGSYFGLRGNGQHTFLLVSNIEKGVFPDRHPWGGKKYLAIANMEDKTTKLTYANHTLLKNPNARIAVDSEPRQCIQLFLLKLSPNQEQLYC